MVVTVKTNLEVKRYQKILTDLYKRSEKNILSGDNLKKLFKSVDNAYDTFEVSWKDDNGEYYDGFELTHRQPSKLIIIFFGDNQVEFDIIGEPDIENYYYGLNEMIRQYKKHPEDNPELLELGGWIEKGQLDLFVDVKDLRDSPLSCKELELTLAERMYQRLGEVVSDIFRVKYLEVFLSNSENSFEAILKRHLSNVNEPGNDKLMFPEEFSPPKLLVHNLVKLLIDVKGVFRFYNNNCRIDIEGLDTRLEQFEAIEQSIAKTAPLSVEERWRTNVYKCYNLLRHLQLDKVEIENFFEVNQEKLFYANREELLSPCTKLIGDAELNFLKPNGFTKAEFATCLLETFI